MSVSDWIPVVKGVDFRIDFDMETNPLFIKTIPDDVEVSESIIHVEFLDGDRQVSGGVVVDWTQAIGRFSLSHCKNADIDFDGIAASLLLSLADADEIIWRIKKTSEPLSIEIACNDQVIGNFELTAMCDKEKWEEKWSRKVKKIMFSSWASASHFYKASPSRLLELYIVNVMISSTKQNPRLANPNLCSHLVLFSQFNNCFGSIFQ